MTLNTFFFDGMHTDERRKFIMQSKVWPVVVAAINATDGRLKVGFIGSDHVDLVNGMGMIVAAVYFTPGGTYKFSVYSEGHDTGTGFEQSKSKRPKYLASKLRKAKHDATGLITAPAGEDHEALMRALYWADLTPNKIVRDALTQTIRSVYPSYRPPTIEVDSEMATTLMKVFMKEMAPVEVSQSMTTQLENSYKRFVEQRDKMNESFKTARDMFSQDKWFLMYDYRKVNDKPSVIVGAISSLPMQAAIDHYVSYGGVVDSERFTFAQPVVPLQWYPSFEQIPDDIRKELEVQLMMYKVHKDNSKLLPDLPGGFQLWAEGGMAFMSGWNEASVILMDKQP